MSISTTTLESSSKQTINKTNDLCEKMEIESPFEYLTFNSVVDQFSPKQYSNHDGFKLRSLKGAVKALLLFSG